MDILEILKKIPKFVQVILSDSQIAFSGEDDFVNNERLIILSNTVRDLKAHIERLETEIDNLSQAKCSVN